MTKIALKDGDANDILEAFRIAKERISAMELLQMQAKARKDFRLMRVDPFVALGVPRPSPDPWARKITDRQAAALRQDGVEVRNLDAKQAGALISTAIERRRNKLSSYKQVQLMIKSGFDPARAQGMTRDVASRLIDELRKNKWEPPAGWGDCLR